MTFTLEYKMASTAAMRICHGRFRALFLSNKFLYPSTGVATVAQRLLSTTRPVMTFEAIRGPYTPEEKKQKSGMLSASNQWKMERALSLALLGVFPAAFFIHGPVIDHALSLSFALHAHWGMQHIVQDYVTKFVPRAGILMYILSSLTFAGLIYFNYNDVGLTRAVQMFWNL